MDKAEEAVANDIFKFIKGNFREKMTDEGIEVTDINEKKFLLTISKVVHPLRVISCTGCDTFSICTVREAVETLQRPLALVSGGFIDLYQFVGGKCKHFKETHGG